MSANTPIFGDLYDYNSSNGVVIPETSQIRSNIISAFEEIFGREISTESETPIGRLIEALTLLFKSVCGVNAQNANLLNPEVAIGQALDMLGALFGISRDGMSDSDYRIAITSSQSRGRGFVESIRRAITSKSGVKSVCVMNNGKEDPAVLPDSNVGVAVNPHSVYICVAGGTDADIAAAINETISAGCAMIQPGFPAGQTVTTAITDPTTGTVSNITFYRPAEAYTKIEVVVRSSSYTGDDIATDTQNIIKSFLSDGIFSRKFTAADIISVISSAGIGIVCTDATIYASDDGQTGWQDVSTSGMFVRPNRFIDACHAIITVEIG